MEHCSRPDTKHVTRVSLQKSGKPGGASQFGRTIIVLLVCLGVVAAWFSRKPTAQAPWIAADGQQTNSPDARTAWKPLGETLPFGPANHRPLPMPPVSATPPATPASAIPFQPPQAPPPPMMAGVPFAPPAPSTPAPSAKVSLQWSPPKDEPAPELGYLTHRVSEGDTLSSLSRRYLGSSLRYREIYEANRATLPSPDRLVVGKELKIPLTGHEPAHAPPALPTAPPPKPTTFQPAAARTVTQQAPTSTGELPTGMKTIQPGVWRRGDPSRLAQRTYAVRASDTLAGIAFQFYGDPGRAGELYEANRYQMTGPDDLRAGMVLIVP
jgi:nucleoid-associated protein YgaU